MPENSSIDSSWSASNSSSSGGDISATSDSDRAQMQARQQSQTTAQNLAYSQTSEDALLGRSAQYGTAYAQEACMASCHGNLPPEPNRRDGFAKETLVDIRDSTLNYLSEDHAIQASLFESNDEKATRDTFISGKVEYTAPKFDFDSSKSKVDAGAGLVLDATVGRLIGDTPITHMANVMGTLTVGTLNANAKTEIKVDMKSGSPNGNAQVSLGAEAMAINAKVAADVSITPKTIADTVSSVYNSVVDPIVDYVAGYDVADMPDAPQSWDHGVTFGGHVVGGFGASWKGSAGIAIGNGKGFKASASMKAGLGPVGGIGVTFGVK